MTHRKLILGTLLFFASIFAAHAQCVVPPGFLCITQAQGDKIAELTDKYAALQDAFKAAQKQIAALQVSSDTKDALIATMTQAGTIASQLDTAKDKYIVLLQQIDKLKDDIIERQSKQLSKGKSGLDKVLKFLQIAYYVAAGLVIVL